MAAACAARLAGGWVGLAGCWTPGPPAGRSLSAPPRLNSGTPQAGRGVVRFALYPSPHPPFPKPFQSSKVPHCGPPNLIGNMDSTNDPTPTPEDGVAFKLMASIVLIYGLLVAAAAWVWLA